GAPVGLVFDSSSLIILNEVGLLRDLIRLPIALATTQSVLAEVHSATVHELSRRGAIGVVTSRREVVPPEIRLRLGSGETSVIAWVVENPAYWAVLDERLARD